MGIPLTNLGLTERAAMHMPVLRAEAYPAPSPGFVLPASAQQAAIRGHRSRVGVRGFPFLSVPRIPTSRCVVRGIFALTRGCARGFSTVPRYPSVWHPV